MSTLVPSRKLLVPSTPSSNTLLHKHANKAHPQKQLLKGQAEQEPFHTHRIQDTFLHLSSEKKLHMLFLSVCKILSPEAQVCGCYVRAHTDANSCTTIAKAGKRKRRGGGSREEDAARPEGGSRHHSPDAEMPGQERPVVASIPDDFPGGSLPAAVWRCPRQPAQMSPRRCCSGPSFAAQAPANLVERIPFLHRPCRLPPPPAALRSPLRRAAGLGRRKISGRGVIASPPFPSALLTRRA